MTDLRPQPESQFDAWWPCHNWWAAWLLVLAVISTVPAGPRLAGTGLRTMAADPVDMTDVAAPNVPRYRAWPAPGVPRRRLKSPPDILLQDAPQLVALTATGRDRQFPLVGVDTFGVVRRFAVSTEQAAPQRPDAVKLLACAAISPDASRHAVADLWGNVILHQNGAEPRSLPRSKSSERTTSLRFSADGRQLAAATSAGTITVWDAVEAKQVATRTATPGAVQLLAFSPTTGLLASASLPGDVHLLALDDDSKSTSIQAGIEKNTALAFAPDGQHLAIGTDGGRVRLVDLATGRETELTGHTFAVWSVAFDPQHDRLATASWDGTIKIWDTTTHELLASYKEHAESISQLAFTADGGLISSSLDRTCKYWGPDIPSFAPVAELVGRPDPIWVAAYAPDGKQLFVGGDAHRFELWDLAGGKLLWNQRGHPTTRCATFSPRGDLLATGGSDREVCLWNVVTGKRTHTMQGHPGLVSAVCFTPDGKSLVSVCDGRAVKRWNVADGQEEATLVGHQRQIYCAAISPDGRRLVTGGGNWTADVPGELIVWDLAKGEMIQRVDGHRLAIWMISFSADGQQIATSSSDGTVKVHDLATLQVRQTLRHPTWVRPASFSPDGKLLAVGRGDGSVRLWETSGWKERLALDAHNSFTFYLQFSPDGSQLATAGQDGTVRLWAIDDLGDR